MKKRYPALILSLLSLVGCDTKDKTPLSGQREAILVIDNDLSVDPMLQSEKIQLSQSLNNADWSQSGGNPSHLMPPSSLGDPKKLELKWRQSIGFGSSQEQRLISGPVVANNMVFTIDSSGTVKAFHVSTGDLKWSKSTSTSSENVDTQGGGIAFDNGVVFVTTSFGDVLALDHKNGELLWQRRLDAPMRAAPTLANGHVYVITINNTSHALHAQTGEHLWSHSGVTESAGLLGAASPAVDGELVVVAYSSGEVYALRNIDGGVMWSEALSSAVRADSLSSIPHIRARPIIDSNRVYLVSHGGRMAAVDRHSGHKSWQKDVAGIRSPALDNHYLFLITNTNQMICLNHETGGIYWINALPKLGKNLEKLFWAGPVLSNQYLVFTGSNGEVAFVSPENGKVHHILKTGRGDILISPVIAKNSLFILNEDGELLCYQQK